MQSCAAFLLVVVIAGVAAILLPKSYHSEGMLLVRLGKENATLDPTVTMSQEPVVAVPLSRDNELNSVVEILKSRSIAEKVVDMLGPDFILGHSTPGPDAAGPPGRVKQFVDQGLFAWEQSKAVLRHLTGTAELGERQRAVLELISDYWVSSARKSDLIQIGCKGPSPEWSQKVVAALMEVYQTEHVRLNRPIRSVEFFVEQTGRAHKELLAKQEALRDLKTASGIFSPNDQRQTFAGRLSRLEEELLQSQATSKVSESRIATLREQLKLLPAEQVESVTTGFSNEGTDQMRSQLYQLEIRKDEAAAKFTGVHPTMRALDEQMQASRAAANHQEPTRTHVSKTPNWIYQDTQAALLQEQTLLSASQSRNNILTRQLADARGQMKNFNQQELLISSLDREIDVCQATYRKYAAGMEQARIDQAREMARISNITVAQPATVEPVPVFPKPGMFLAAGILCGLVSAVAVAKRAEVADHSFRRPEDIERRLGMNVLGAIPRLGARQSTNAANGRS